jgi:hypothetical protein
LYGGADMDFFGDAGRPIVYQLRGPAIRVGPLILIINQ